MQSTVDSGQRRRNLTKSPRQSSLREEVAVQSTVDSGHRRRKLTQSPRKSSLREEVPVQSTVDSGQHQDDRWVTELGRLNIHVSRCSLPEVYPACERRPQTGLLEPRLAVQNGGAGRRGHSMPPSSAEVIAVLRQEARREEQLPPRESLLFFSW